MSADKWGGPGWLNKLSWLFDASVTIAGFSGEEIGEFFPPVTHWLIFFFFVDKQIRHCRLGFRLITDHFTFILYQHRIVCWRLAIRHLLYEGSRRCLDRVVEGKTT
jgi:hypothetical protein